MDYYLEEVLVSLVLFFATAFIVLTLKAQSDKRKIDSVFRELDEVYQNFIGVNGKEEKRRCRVGDLKSKIVEYCVFSDYPFHFCVKQYDGYITVVFKTFLVKQVRNYPEPVFFKGAVV